MNVNTLILPFADFTAALPARGRLFGLDVGTKTIGLALSDEGRRLATPYETLTRGKFATTAATLFKHIDAQSVHGLVIGYPLHMDGGQGAKTQSVRQFCHNVLRVRHIPITLWDERLSTVAAERALLEADMSRAKRAAAIDKVAASLLLQSFLDRLNTK
jgi:putative Holliday junction resolvase